MIPTLSTCFICRWWYGRSVTQTTLRGLHNLGGSGYLIYLEDNVFQLVRRYAGLFSFLFALFGLTTLLLAGQIAAQTVVGAETDPVWEDGLLLTADDQPPMVEILAAPTTAGTHYRTFAGTRFQSTASELTYAPLGGAIYATAIPPTNLSFTLDFDLPPGAEITEVVFFVRDNHDPNDMNLSLRSYDPTTAQVITLASAITSGASPALQTIVIPVDPPVQVNPATTAYRLRVAPTIGTSAHLLYGARVGYTMPTAYLPLITRD